MPLKKGTWVKLKEHDTWGVVVEQRRGDAELPEPERGRVPHTPCLRVGILTLPRA